MKITSVLCGAFVLASLFGCGNREEGGRHHELSSQDDGTGNKTYYYLGTAELYLSSPRKPDVIVTDVLKRRYLASRNQVESESRLIFPKDPESNSTIELTLDVLNRVNKPFVGNAMRLVRFSGDLIEVAKCKSHPADGNVHGHLKGPAWDWTVLRARLICSDKGDWSLWSFYESHEGNALVATISQEHCTDKTCRKTKPGAKIVETLKEINGSAYLAKCRKAFGAQCKLN